MTTIGNDSAMRINQAMAQGVENQDVAAARGQHPQVVMSAAGQAYLKSDGAAPVPAFAGPPQPDNDSQGKQALQTMQQHVSGDLDTLAGDWNVGTRGSDEFSSGINYFELIEVLVKLDAEEAKASNETRIAEINEVASTYHDAADAKRDGAASALTGALVSSGLTMAGGAVSIGAAGVAAGSEGGGATATEAAPPVEVEGEGAMTESVSGGAEESEPGGISMEEETPALDLEETGETGESESDALEDETTAEMEGEVEEMAADSESGRTPKSGDKESVIDDETKQALKQLSRDTKVNAATLSSQTKLQIGQGIAQGLQGAGAGAKGIGDFGQQEYEAKAKDEEAAATEEQAILEREKEYGRSAEDNCKKMLDMYSAIEQSRHESLQRVVSV